MSKAPRRKKAKRSPPRGRTKKTKGTKKGGPVKRPAAAEPTTPSFPQGNLDLRTLVLLSMGDWSELADLEWPPERIRRWLEKADIRQIRGMLLTTLHRWHELRRDAAGD